MGHDEHGAPPVPYEAAPAPLPAPGAPVAYAPPPGPAHGAPVYPPPPAGYAMPAPGAEAGYAVPPGHPGAPPVMLVPGQMPPGSVVMIPGPGAPKPFPVWWPGYPTDVTCPGCNQNVTTRVGKENGLGTWLIAGGICLVGCGFGCCLIPFFVDGCKDSIHTCPNCNKFLGMHKLV